MPLQPLNGYTKLISSLEDIPTMSAADLKAYFDSSPEEIRVAFNQAIAVLRSIKDGDSGADNVGATPIKDIEGNTVQTILESLKVLIDKKIGLTDVFTKKELESTVEGSSGASKIKASPISGLTGDNVQSFLQSLKVAVDELVLNQIPDGSITIDKLNDNVKDLFNNVGAIYKSVAYLMLNQAVSKRVTKGGTFGTSFDTTYGMEFDTFKSSSQTALSIGDTTITLDSVQGLAVGKEITIYDDVNLERRTVSAINGNTITVDEVTKDFKPQFNVARSMVILDAVNMAMEFGGWDHKETINQIDKAVTASSYDTDGARKLIRLQNGWILSALKNKTNLQFPIYVSKNKGASFSDFTTFKFPMKLQSDDVALASKDNRIYCLRVWGETLSFTQLDTEGKVVGKDVILDSGQTLINSIFLAVDQTIGHIHAAWTSKNPTYPNSFNIRYAKSIDGGVSFSNAEQVTVLNQTTINTGKPQIAFTNDGKPVIIYEFINTTGSYSIGTVRKDASGSWSNFTAGVYSGNTYIQNNPTAQSVGDLIVTAWQGYDSTNPSTFYIRFSKSIDGGVNWSTMKKLVPGINPSITINSVGEYFIVYEETGITKYIKSIDGGVNWSTPEIMGNGTNPSTLLDNTSDFSVPLSIRKGSSNVLFNGTWDEDTSSPLIENDVRFKTDDTTRIAMWIEHDLDLNITGQWNGVDLEKSVDGTETQLTTDPVQKQPSEVKLTMKRNTVDDDLKVTRILGGVA